MTVTRETKCKCSKCGEQRDGGHTKYCRRCHAAYMRAWRVAVREKGRQLEAEIERLRADLAKVSLAKAYSEERVVEQMAEIEHLAEQCSTLLRENEQLRFFDPKEMQDEIERLREAKAALLSQLRMRP